MQIRVWDPLVRIFHWGLVILFLANAFIVEAGSDLHEWLGYSVMGLIITRILWGLVGTTYARFSSFPPSFKAAKTQLSDIATGRHRLHVGHTPLGALMIYNLIFSLLMIVLSGYLMTTDMFWGVEWPEELHEAFVNWVEFCAVLHIAAVYYESRRSGINLPKAMVTGTKAIPDEA